MNFASKAVVWILLCSALTVAGWKGLEVRREYRVISDAGNELGGLCKVSVSPCIKSAGWDY